MTDTIEKAPACTTMKWFAALDDERRSKAIKGTYLWKLTADEELMIKRLGSLAELGEHPNASKVFKKFEDQSFLFGSGIKPDPVIDAMVSKVPDIMLEAYLGLTAGYYLVALRELGATLLQYAPKGTIALITELESQHKSIKELLTDSGKTSRTSTSRSGNTFEQVHPSRRLPQEIVNCHLLAQDHNLLVIWKSLVEHCGADIPDRITKAYRGVARASYISHQVKDIIELEF